MKTFKELIDEITIYYSETSFPVPPYQILELIEEFKIFYENEISSAITNEQMTSDFLRDKIDEKDKEINNLKTKQLFKEDFNVADYCWDKIIKLKDNSKYEKLTSKEKK
ncbi:MULTISPECIES: hypothetical protein [unclassified Spiroplasma]|uniref:hypothetical protein n=1 Tax=unclassified Spiroplasma TaxID=2637901 RepID=UPI0030CB0589